MKCKQTKVFCLIHHFFRAYVSIVIISLLFSQFVYADGTETLYESSVKVDPGKSENELIAIAFYNVLIKVSGRSNVTSSVGYKAMLGKAKDAISQFRYDYKTIPASDETQQTEGVTAADDSEKKGAPEKEKWFWVRFNSTTIDGLLKEAQLPVWGKVRPSTLVWLSQEIKGKRYLQSEHDVPQIYDIIEQQGARRGISLMFPFLDLQDQSNVSADDIWGNFTDAILLASRRYQAQATVTISLYKDSGGVWVSKWNLLMLGDVKPWEVRDRNIKGILVSGVDELADRLAQQFTQVVDEGNDSGMLIQVNNVSDFKAFQELDDYLRNLATVKSAALIQMKQEQVIYNIAFIGDKNSFMQEIRLGDLLTSVERSRIDNDNSFDEDKDYKPVILGDLNKSEPNLEGVSQRQKTLESLNASRPDVRPVASVPEETEAASEKVVEELIPELEYWLVR